MSAPVVAIDGPAASGKSSTAAAVAGILEAVHLDSGALYRALTAVALELPRRTAPAILARAEQRGLSLQRRGDDVVPVLDGSAAEALLRSVEVNELVSEVSAMPEVRDWVNRRLRDAVAAGSGRLFVLDGRDIGTAVFPDAAVKVFLTATPEARARRRLLQRGGEPDGDTVAREAALLAERDRRDSSREVAPLRQADDARVLDTSHLGFDQQVGAILRYARERLPQG